MLQRLLRIATHDVTVLRCDDPLRERDPRLDDPRFVLLEVTPGEHESVSLVYDALGNVTPHGRTARRFANGLRFLFLQHDGQPVAGTWIAAGGARYLDEFAWLVPVTSDAFWVRDVFVPRAMRGQGLFRLVVQTIAQRLVPGCTAAWSDVDTANEGSLLAHRRVGFVPLARVRAVHAGNAWVWRSALPPALHGVEEIDPPRRLLRLDATRSARHRDLIA